MNQGIGTGIRCGVRLCKHLVEQQDQKMIIFAASKLSVDIIVRSLKGLNLGVKGFHSGFSQQEREEMMLDFRSGKTKVLVATDIVSRGIDVDDIDLIINFTVPGDAEDYVHRIGRTARAQRSGLAITLINGDDVYKFQKIEKLIEKTVHKIPLPEDFPEGPDYSAQRPKFHKGGRKNFTGKKRNFKKR